MKIAIFAYSRQGCKTARTVMEHFKAEEIRAFTKERFEESGFQPLCQPSSLFYGSMFEWADTMVFIGSCGIAVREIAPHIRDKKSDPAVIVVDELAHFTISLLSGHIGGANAIASKLAKSLDSIPVITTASDINHKFSADAWATQNGYIIADIHKAKAVSSGILEQDIPLHSDFPVLTPYPNGLVPGITGDVGICISYRTDEPFDQTLRLIPKILHLGIGCKKGISAKAICETVDTVLKQNHIDRRSIKCVASIDLKAQESGLLAYCQENNWPVSFYSAEDLKMVKGSFTPSTFVQSVTGIDNVCERAALYGAEKLIVKKNALNGVTAAIAAEKWEVRFE